MFCSVVHALVPNPSEHLVQSMQKSNPVSKYCPFGQPQTASDVVVQSFMMTFERGQDVVQELQCVALLYFVIKVLF